MSLKHSYTLFAPLYDAVIEPLTRAARRRSIGRLAPAEPKRVLLNGVGTGLDLPLLPRQHRYVGLDLTAAMLAKTQTRRAELDFAEVRGDAQRLPFADGAFDAALLHLILAVVPAPALCLAETARVVHPGGEVLVFDKFLRPRQRAPLRRALNPFLARVATRLDVVFENVLATVPELEMVADEPALAGGWFRLIRLRRT
jgi:ubiquinone/menaquinone biosynthesis C-methylase UbiE